MAKQRKYSNEYIKFGFTSISKNGMTKPQCVLCNAALSVEAMKPSKLKRHFNTKHPEHVVKNLTFFEGKKLILKRQKLDSKRYFQQQNKALVEVSYEAALAIAKQTKPNSLGETLEKPCAVTMVKMILEESAAKKLNKYLCLMILLGEGFHTCLWMLNSK